MPTESNAAAIRVARRLAPSLRELVGTVGRYVARAQRRLQARDVGDKGHGDPVTAVDLRAERRLRAQLLQWLPEAGFVGEESPAVGVDRAFVWVVDPLDGTSNFARGLPCFAVAVALLWRGQPVLAGVHTMPDDAVVHAIAGHGAFRNGRRLRLRPEAGRGDDRGIFGCQWFRRPGPAELEVVRRLQRRGARLRLLGSTVVQILDVATGRLDANIQAPGRLWDLAAALLVATEAGACCTDWHGRSIFPIVDWNLPHRATLVAPKVLHRTLLAAMRGLGPD
jgi:myo-inositol-1(or 4)-monophosphatase